jgi:hypothetical protein
MMLLQTPHTTDAGFREYIAFWQRMQTQYSHIFTYKIESQKHIEETYNQIVAQLQDTVPSAGCPVLPGEPVRVFVSRYVEEMVVTIIHKSGEPPGEVRIIDPLGNQVLDSDPGVSRFLGEENPIEVISVGSAWLERELPLPEVLTDNELRDRLARLDEPLARLLGPESWPVIQKRTVAWREEVVDFLARMLKARRDQVAQLAAL